MQSGKGLQLVCLPPVSPLLKRKPYQLSFAAPEGFNLGAEVFVVRFTGELFTSYE